MYNLYVVIIRFFILYFFFSIGVDTLNIEDKKIKVFTQILTLTSIFLLVHFYTKK